MAFFFTAYSIWGNVFVQRQTNNPKTSQQSGRWESVFLFDSLKDTISFSIASALPIFQIISVRDEVFSSFPWKGICSHNLWNSSWEPLGLFRLFTLLQNLQSLWLCVLQPSIISKVQLISGPESLKLPFPRGVWEFEEWRAMCNNHQSFIRLNFLSNCYYHYIPDPLMQRALTSHEWRVGRWKGF